MPPQSQDLWGAGGGKGMVWAKQESTQEQGGGGVGGGGWWGGVGGVLSDSLLASTQDRPVEAKVAKAEGCKLSQSSPHSRDYSTLYYVPYQGVLVQGGTSQIM